MRDKDYRKVLLGLLLLSAAIVFALLAWVNHANFRTNAFDMGYYNKVLYDLSHFHFYDFSLNPDYESTFADHFEPALILIAPLTWIFGSYTLLIVQIGFVLIGGLGVYRFVERRAYWKWLAPMALAHFFLSWGLYAALSFDFHTSVLGAMLVPWFLDFFLDRKWKKAMWLLILILLLKESLALWMTFVCLGALLLRWRDPKSRKWGGIFAGASFVWLILCLKVIIPFFSGGEGFRHFEFSVLGDSMGEALSTIFTQPGVVWDAIWHNHLPNPEFDPLKAELHWMVMMSGGLVFAVRPQFLLMLLPIYGQKLFNNNFAEWGLNQHYCIEFAPILSLGLFAVLARIRRAWVAGVLGWAAILMSFMALEYWHTNRWSWYHSRQINVFYASEHFETPGYDPANIREAMALIPDDASVSANSALVAHLARRREIYMWPDGAQARYLIFNPETGHFPLSKDELLADMDRLRADPNWEIRFEKGKTLLFERVPSD